MEQTSNEQQPKGVLFGVMAYETQGEYEDFLKNLDKKSLKHTFLTLHSALRYSQTKGIFTIEEAEVISVTLRRLGEILKPQK